MKRHFAIQGWALAAVSLIVFCWLGFAAVRFGEIFKGLEVDLPVATQLAFAYGPIAFPVVGIAAAALLILSDVLFHRRWMQWAFSALFALAVILALKAMLISGIFVGPARKANKPTAGNAGWASRLNPNMIGPACLSRGRWP
jgi:hypothetical protein